MPDCDCSDADISGRRRECCLLVSAAARARFVQGFDGDALTQSPLRRNRAPGGITFTPIFAAFQTGQIEFFQMLISAGADVNAVMS
jgi:hypothetical protein